MSRRAVLLDPTEHPHRTQRPAPPSCLSLDDRPKPNRQSFELCASTAAVPAFSDSSAVDNIDFLLLFYDPHNKLRPSENPPLFFPKGPTTCSPQTLIPLIHPGRRLRLRQPIMTPLERFSKWIQLKIYQTEVTYSVYIFTPAEKFVFCTFAVRGVFFFGTDIGPSAFSLSLSNAKPQTRSSSSSLPSRPSPPFSTSRATSPSSSAAPGSTPTATASTRTPSWRPPRQRSRPRRLRAPSCGSCERGGREGEPLDGCREEPPPRAGDSTSEQV